MCSAVPAAWMQHALPTLTPPLKHLPHLAAGARPSLCLAPSSDSSSVSSPVAVSGHPQSPPPAPAGPLPSPRIGVSVSPSPHVEYGQGPGGSSDASALTVLGLGSWHGGPGDLGPGLSQRPGLSRFHPLPLSGSLPAVPVRTGDSPGPPGGPRISAAPPPPTPSTPSQTPHL